MLNSSFSASIHSRPATAGRSQDSPRPRRIGRPNALAPSGRARVRSLLLGSLLGSILGCGGGDPQSSSAPQTPTSEGARDFAIVYSGGGLSRLRPDLPHDPDVGGMDRLATAVAELRSNGQPSLYLEAGDSLFPKRTTAGSLPQLEHKARAVADVFEMMKLDAYLPGASDLQAGTDFLRELDEQHAFVMLASNLYGATSKEPLFGRFLLRELGGVRVAVMGLLGPDLVSGEDARVHGDFEARDPAETARSLIEELRGKADFFIAITNLMPLEDQQLAKAVPGLGLIVGSNRTGGFAGPKDESGTPIVFGKDANELVGRIEIHLEKGGTDLQDDNARGTLDHLIESNQRMLDDLLHQAGVASLEQLQAAPGRNKLKRKALQFQESLDKFREKLANVKDVESGSRCRNRYVDVAPPRPGDPQVGRRIDAYRDSLATFHQDDAKAHPEVLAEWKQTVAPLDSLPHLVGSETCGSCHAEQLAFWKSTMHPRGYAPLTDQGRQYDVECLTCHTTGWMARGGFAAPFEAQSSGWQGLQCEGCHGLGSNHALLGGFAVPGSIPAKDAGAMIGACRNCHSMEIQPMLIPERDVPKVACPKMDRASEATMGAYRAAAGELSTAFERAASNAVVAERLARVKAKLGDAEGAVAVLDRAIDAASDPATLLELEGDLLMGQLEYKKAIDAYERLLGVLEESHAKEQPIIHDILAQLYLTAPEASGVHDPKRALEHARAAADRLGDHPQILETLALAFEANGDVSKALFATKRALAYGSTPELISRLRLLESRLEHEVKEKGDH